MLDLALLFVVIGGVMLAVATLLQLFRVRGEHGAETRSVFGSHAGGGRRQAAPTESQESGGAVSGRRVIDIRRDDRPPREEPSGGATGVGGGTRIGTRGQSEITDGQTTTGGVGREVGRGEKPPADAPSTASRKALEVAGDEESSPFDSGDPSGKIDERTKVVEDSPEATSVDPAEVESPPPVDLEEEESASQASDSDETPSPGFVLSGHYFMIRGLRNPPSQDTKQ